MLFYLNHFPLRSRPESSSSNSALESSLENPNSVSITPQDSSESLVEKNNVVLKHPLSSDSSQAQSKEGSPPIQHKPKRLDQTATPPDDKDSSGSDSASPTNTQGNVLEPVTPRSRENLEALAHLPSFDSAIVKTTVTRPSFNTFVSPGTPSANFKAVSHIPSASIRAVVELDNNEVSFLISANRPQTELGKKQGDHVTAFATFVELLYNSTNDKENAEEIITGIRNVIDAIFPPHIIADFEEMYEKFNEEQKAFLSRDKRKMLTAMLRSLIDDFSHNEEVAIDENLITQVKTSLKYSEASIIANFIADIGNQLILRLNSWKGMAFTSQIEENNSQAAAARAKAAGAQGNEVKQALYCLRLINLLKKIQDSSSADKIEKLKSDVMSGMREKNSALKQGLKNILNNIFAELPPENLDVYVDLYLKKDGERLFELLEKNHNEITNTIGQKIGKLFDYIYCEGRQIDDLNHMLARHLAIVFNTFDSLKTYIHTEHGFDNIMAQFVGEEVVTNQGWGKYGPETSPAAVYSSIIRRLRDKKLINLENFVLYSDCKLKSDILDSKFKAVQKEDVGISK